MQAGAMKPPYIILLFIHCIFTGITAIQAGLCPSGWNSAPNRRNCFLLVPNVSSWNDAEGICQNHSSHLAALTSVQDLKYVQTLCRNVSTGCWVGGHGVRSKKGFSWQWSDHQSHWNKSAFPGAPSFLNCSQSSCRKTNLTEFCTLVMNRNVPLVGDKCKNSYEFVCMLSKGNKCEPGHCHKEYTIILAVVSGFILFTTFSVVIWLLVYKRNRRRRRSRKISSPSAASLVPPSWRVYTNDELRMITKNFGEGNRLLGDAMTKTGGTYGGTLPDGSLVAVKKLKKSSLQSKKEFLSEIGRIARLRHDNLVAIKGCCYEHNERYIVYEFVANGPLDRWLHHLPRGGRSLDWGMRMRIATTLAQGIAFTLTMGCGAHTSHDPFCRGEVSDHWLKKIFNCLNSLMLNLVKLILGQEGIVDIGVFRPQASILEDMKAKYKLGAMIINEDVKCSVSELLVRNDDEPMEAVGCEA